LPSRHEALSSKTSVLPETKQKKIKDVNRRFYKENKQQNTRRKISALSVTRVVQMESVRSRQEGYNLGSVARGVEKLRLAFLGSRNVKGLNNWKTMCSFIRLLKCAVTM
jgi:hypothetical protein